MPGGLFGSCCRDGLLGLCRTLVKPEKRFFGGPPAGPGPTRLLEVEARSNSGRWNEVGGGGWAAASDPFPLRPRPNSDRFFSWGGGGPI